MSFYDAYAKTMAAKQPLVNAFGEMLDRRANSNAANALAGGDYSQAMSALASRGDLANVDLLRQRQVAQQDADRKRTTDVLLHGADALSGYGEADRDAAFNSVIAPSLRAAGVPDAAIAKLATAPKTDRDLEAFRSALGGKPSRDLKVIGGRGYVWDANAGKTVGDPIGGDPYMKLGQGETFVPVDAYGKPLADADGNPLGTQPAPQGQSAQPQPTAAHSGGLGIRNNNWLNIRAGSDQWQGQTGANGGFVTFDTPENGLRAADRVLQTYATKHGINTVAGIVGRWAPPGENDTQAYIATVAKGLGVDANAPLNMGDPAVRQRIVHEMSKVENGFDPFAQGGTNSGTNPGRAGTNSGSPPPVLRGPAKPDRQAQQMAQQDRQYAMQLRKEFDGLPDVKAYNTVATSYDTIRRLSTGTPTAATDISLIFAYMKMLDPDTGVREGEYANAQNATGVPEQIRNAYNKALDGQFLSPKQRGDFTASAGVLYDARKERYDAVLEQYQGYASQSGLPDGTIRGRAVVGGSAPAGGAPRVQTRPSAQSAGQPQAIVPGLDIYGGSARPQSRQPVTSGPGWKIVP